MFGGFNQNRVVDSQLVQVFGTHFKKERNVTTVCDTAFTMCKLFDKFI